MIILELIFNGILYYQPLLGPDFCGDNRQEMMVVARIPESGNEPLEIVFRGNGTEVRTLRGLLSFI